MLELNFKRSPCREAAMDRRKWRTLWQGVFGAVGDVFQIILGLIWRLFWSIVSVVIAVHEIHELRDYAEPIYTRYIYIVIYLVLWIVSLASAINAIQFLYKGRVDREAPVPFISPKVYVVAMVASSAVTLVLGFATAYFDCSLRRENAFNKPLSLPMALYFSVVTFATVGYGDIYPTDDFTRGLVIAEITFSMLYTIGLFSLIASFLRSERS
jgi:hypothetical protein